MTGILYKYRNLNNYENFIDIIINNRLYAAEYNKLNDPMEGLYYYGDGIIDENLRRKIYNNKKTLRLCSLTKNSNNFLMWSHYADGHKGIAIGVRIDENAFKVKDIEYIPNLRYYDNTIDLDAINILSTKINLWSYEEEVRAFTEDGTTYINVSIEEIHIGSKMSHQHYSLIRKLIDKINPNIRLIRNPDFADL